MFSIDHVFTFLLLWKMECYGCMVDRWTSTSVHGRCGIIKCMLNKVYWYIALMKLATVDYHASTWTHPKTDIMSEDESKGSKSDLAMARSVPMALQSNYVL